MKTLISTLVWVSAILVSAEPHEFKKDFVIYEATVKGKTIKVFLSESPFEPKNYKITSGKESWPKVNGRTVVGFGETDANMMTGLSHLTRLAISFDGHVVEAPKELIAHVFLPCTETTFDQSFRYGMVSISSDAKAVVVDIGVGDGAWSGHIAFTFTAKGTCSLGVPSPPEP
jgi:hypothetical protein